MAVHYYEVHVNVPDWKQYGFQFISKKQLKNRDEVIEQVVQKGLLYNRNHLPFITFAQEIEESQFLPDDQMYLTTTMAQHEYDYMKKANPDYFTKIVQDRKGRQKPKKEYARQVEPK